MLERVQSQGQRVSGSTPKARRSDPTPCESWSDPLCLPLQASSRLGGVHPRGAGGPSALSTESHPGNTLRLTGSPALVLWLPHDTVKWTPRCTITKAKLKGWKPSPGQSGAPRVNVEVSGVGRAGLHQDW